MPSAVPQFVSVTYIDPWGQPPPHTFQAGLIVTVVPPTPGAPGLPTDPVLAARLLQGGVECGVAVGASPGTVRLIPAAPLGGGGVPFSVQVEWVQRGTTTPTWNDPTLIATAPVLSASPQLLSASFDGGEAVVSWDLAATAGTATGACVNLLENGLTNAAEILAPGGSGKKAFVPTQGAVYALYLRGVQPIAPSATGGFAGPFSAGPFAPPLAVPTTAPTVSAVSYDGESLTVTWSPLATPEPPVPEIAYTLHLLRSGKVVASYPAGPTGASARIGQPADPATLAVATSVRYGALSGPLGAAQPVIAAAPTVTGAGFDPLGAELKVAWSAPPGAGAYTVEVSPSSGSPITKKVQSSPLVMDTVELPAASLYRLRLRAAASLASDAVTGPWSQLIALLGLPPAGVQVGYDARLARIAWEPPPGEPVSGYLVTVLSDSLPISSQTAAAASPGTAIPVPFDATKTRTAVVQALTASAGDPLLPAAGRPSAPLALFQPGLYPVPAGTEPAVPPHIRPARKPAMDSENIVLQLPELFTTHQTANLPTNAAFAIAALAGGGPFAYTLTIAPASKAWEFPVAQPLRSEVQTLYLDLLSKLKASGLTPLGWSVVQDAIARAMPQTFAETLYYGCGFAPGEGWVDLRPGMVLRVEYQSYQYVGPAALNSAVIDGYLTSGVGEYDIGSYVDSSASWLTGVDAFLSAVADGGVTVPTPTVAANAVAGAGGAIDLYYAQFRQPFYRLVYPPDLAPSESPGTPQPESNVAILAAGDYQTLNAATAALRAGDPLGSGAAATYLRGRTIVTACLRVWLDGTPLVVPVGSTVGNLLERAGRRPPVANGLPLTGISLTRAPGAAVTGAASAPYDTGAGVPIHLDWGAGSAWGGNRDWLSLPLLPGDRLSTGAP
ncbi:MAG TPA: hypothetical protein VNY52_00610 [Solirubrobacteraceae bacterium]|jgi:hypothetical protein|nr:hypothetical protein [Solirubrobacteraceae bacterium]